jgi:hypothetical protein
MRSIATIVFLLAIVMGPQALAQQACPTLVVATNDDTVNGDTSSPCALIGNAGPDGISLREALLAANNATGSGTITITFAPALAGTTIALTGRFAPITNPQITLTGLTSNGQPDITLDATNVPTQGEILFIATSDFAMSGMNIINIPTNFNAMQIGGYSYDLTGQMVSSPQQISGFQITGNSFSNGTGNNTFAIFVSTSPNGTSNSTISNITISNNTFTNLFEAINVGSGGNNNIIQNVSIFGNSFSQMTQNGTSAVELGNTTGTNNTIENVQITQNTFTGNFQGVVLDNNSAVTGSTTQNTLIAGNVFVGNLGAMGLVAGVSSDSNNNTIANTQIVNNLIDLTGYNGSGAATIQIIDSQAGGTNDQVTGVLFVNNTIYNNSSMSPPGWGLWITSSGGVTGVNSFNNIFWGNESSVPLNGIASGQVSYSIVDQSGFSGTNNNVNSDPMFVNASGSDFGLQSASPARGAGTSAGAPSIDIACQPRGSPPSIGAYELNGPNICASPLTTTTTTLGSSPNPSNFDDPVALTATVAPTGGAGTPTGNVNFFDGSTFIGTGTLNGSGAATFTTSALAVGGHQITATYGGDANYVGSTSAALTQTVGAAEVLTVSVTGAGTVTSSPSGINCGSTCNAGFTSGTVVTLTPTPAAGWAFTGWSGGCSGSGGCTVTMNSAQSVTATFNQLFTLTVSHSGNGSVTSSPVGINCGATCSASFASGTAVTLTPTPASGWGFSGWSGACSGSGSCVVTVNAATSVTATFTQLSYTLSVFVSGNGSVTSSPGSISCPGTCSASYLSGTPVTLSATPGGGATFAGWSGGCAGTGGCTVTMNSPESVAASFTTTGASFLNHTWVASSGSDSNNCDLPTPCQTFSGAFAQTNAAGEISCANSSDFGQLLITHAITIDCQSAIGSQTSVGGSNTSGITVVTNSTDTVVLRGLDVDGLGAVCSGGLINVAGAGVLHLQKMKINHSVGNCSGVAFAAEGAATLDVTDSDITDNGSSGIAAGIYIAPQSGALAKVSVADSRINANFFGIIGDGRYGGIIKGMVSGSVVSGNTENGITVIGSGSSVVFVTEQTKVSGNGAAGLFAGGSNAGMLARNTTVIDNTIGLDAENGGVLFTYGNNSINGNTSNGAFTNAVGMQ